MGQLAGGSCLVLWTVRDLEVGILREPELIQYGGFSAMKRLQRKEADDKMGVYDTLQLIFSEKLRGITDYT